MSGPNPSGLCQCGCGQQTWIATTTHKKRGWVKNHPVRYCHGHGSRWRPEPSYAVNEASGCWEWLGPTDGKGYGLLWFKGRTRRAHIVSYEEHRGDVPEGLQLDHLCRNPQCVNPDHLEAVTHAQNTQRGLTAKLTPEQVSSIRQQADADSRLRAQQGFKYRTRGLIVMLALEHGVSRSAIKQLIRGKTWAV